MFAARNIRNDKAYTHKNFLHSNLRWLALLGSKLPMTYLRIKVESLENIDGVGILGDIVVHNLVHPIQECWSLNDSFKVGEIKALQ